jgi:hypothetical protein
MFFKKQYLLFVIITLALSFCMVKSHAQKGKYDTLKMVAWISPEGDTLALSYLDPVQVFVRKILTAEQIRQKQEWTRLRNAVYVTYPYAKAASKIMNEINARLIGVTNKGQRKAIIKSREKELRKEFTDKLTNLSIYQGKILMKLIYRETGNTCYEIIKEYKGGFNVLLYQTIAVIVGTNLKQNYDANGNDKDLEIIVKDVEKMYGYRS